MTVSGSGAFRFSWKMFHNSPNILLIDDNKHGLIARQAGLRERGYRVEIACGGKAGLSKFDEGDFDLVVTDYRMPDVSGAQVLQGVRERRPGIPVVILSGFAAKLALTRQQTGADAVLMKGPSELDDLLRAVGRLLKKRPASAGRSGTSAAAAGA